MGVGGGIAAYKSAYLVRLFRKAGWDVFVVPTEASLQFVGRATWAELSENPVSTSVFATGVGHVELARVTDLIVVAPATADLLAKMYAGLASDLLGNVLLASDAPKVVAPAMHTNMWENAATQRNVEDLESWGVHVIQPLSGDLSSGDVGAGRMAEPEDIFSYALAVADAVGSSPAGGRPLAGRRVVVTAGGTREPLDPVRYLGNRSSGAQGVALARQAASLGANVTLIHAPLEVDLPSEANIEAVLAPSAAEMKSAVEAALVGADALVMAAAVADYAPEQVADKKIKKGEDGGPLTLRLTQNPDILADVATGALRPPVLVGFGAETGSDEEVKELGRQKAIRKGADFLAVNAVGGGRGFGNVDNALTYFQADGSIVGGTSGTKNQVAKDLLLRVAAALDAGEEREH